MDQTAKKTAGVSSATVVNLGKSSRLQAMRDKAVVAETRAQPGPPANRIDDSGLSPELLLARRMIDQRLAEIWAKLPAGKQNSLFKLRYGVDLEQVRNLPIKRLVKLLQIQEPAMQNLAAYMKRMGDLNYNGE